VNAIGVPSLLVKRVGGLVSRAAIWAARRLVACGITMTNSSPP
jgi:hypothetical protein